MHLTRVITPDVAFRFKSLQEEDVDATLTYDHEEPNVADSSVGVSGEGLGEEPKGGELEPATGQKRKLADDVSNRQFICSSTKQSVGIIRLIMKGHPKRR